MQKKIVVIGFFVVLATAALFRISHLNLIEFKEDEAVNLFLTLQYQFGHPFPPGATIASLGFLNPPFFLYLLFPITLLTQDPKIISGIIASIDTLAIGFLFLFYKKYYGFLVSFIAAILLSLSTWSILFSRKIWPQDIVLPFLVLLLYSLHKIIIEKKKIYWLMYTIVSVFLLQLYPATIFFLLPLTILIIFQTKSFDIKKILIGLCIGLIPLIPYILFEVTHNYPDIHALLGVSHKVSYRHAPEIFIRPFQIMNKGDFFRIMGTDIAIFAKRYPLVYRMQVIFYIEYVLVIFGGIIFWKQYPKLRLLLYTTIIVPILYFVLKLEPEMHYFIILTPILFLFAGLGIFSMITYRNIVIQIAGAGIFCTLVVYSFLFNQTFFNFINLNGGLNGAYGEIYAASEKKVNVSLQKYKKDPMYKEMFLASYIHEDYLRGDSPTSRMLYDHKQTKKNLSLLEKRLLAVPEDTTVRDELYAYYTYTTPTKQELHILQQKSMLSQEFSSLFENVYSVYLQSIFRKSYDSTILGFGFEYPKHWSLMEDPKKKEIVLNGDGYTVSLTDTLTCQYSALCNQKQTSKNAYQENIISINTMPIKKIICTTPTQRWCGSYYGPIQINRKTNSFILRVEALTDTMNTLKENTDIVTIIMSSLR